jgi:hypothetical protein
MRHQATQALYAYWNEVRGDRLAPRRLEIQPARIGELLLDSFILERTDRSEFRFRLAGTRVSARFGMNLTAYDFLSCWSDGDRALLDHHLAAITDLGRVGLFTGEGRLASRDPAGAPLSCAFELLVLPLMHTGHAIDRLLCLLVPLEDTGAGAGQRIEALRLLAAEAVWPAGVPEDIPGFSERQSPLHPHVRTARIVRQGRRQFRVYEGGLVGGAHQKGGGL